MDCDGCKQCELILKEDSRPLKDFRLTRLYMSDRIKLKGTTIFFKPQPMKLYHRDDLVYAWNCTCLGGNL